MSSIAMEKMTGKQVVTTVLGVAGLIAAVSAYDASLRNGIRAAEEQNRHEITRKLLEQQPKLLEIRRDQESTYTNIL